MTNGAERVPRYRGRAAAGPGRLPFGRRRCSSRLLDRHASGTPWLG